MPGWPPGLPENFNDLMMATCATFAVGFVLARATLRRIKKIKPAFVYKNVQHDLHSGFILPFFLLMMASSVEPSLLTKIEPKIIFLAGAVSAIAVLKDLFDHDDK